MTRAPLALVIHFKDLPDPRLERTRHHLLSDILVTAICAVIAGADDWVNIELWAKSKEAWLRGFLELPNGIPSHDTFGRVFAKLNPDAFRKCFAAWVQDVAEVLGRHVAIDGKTLRASFNHAAERRAIHMVSAWARETQVVLGQVKTDDKSNEITAIPALLDLLELKGCIVTIDAMGCQKEIAHAIREKGADYLLALKANQRTLHDEVNQRFLDAREKDFAGIEHTIHTTEEMAHGRAERREYVAMPVPTGLAGCDGWDGLRTIMQVVREREIDGKSTGEVHYYISSLQAAAEQMAAYVRGHWSIENELHWCLDVHFREDTNRTRIDHAPENGAILRHMALSLLKQEKTAKVGVKSKRNKAAWDDAYLLKVLQGKGA